jgi:hypothetical protein
MCRTTARRCCGDGRHRKQQHVQWYHHRACQAAASITRQQATRDVRHGARGVRRQARRARPCCGAWNARAAPGRRSGARPIRVGRTRRGRPQRPTRQRVHDGWGAQHPVPPSTQRQHPRTCVRAGTHLARARSRPLAPRRPPGKCAHVPSTVWPRRTCRLHMNVVVSTCHFMSSWAPCDDVAGCVEATCVDSCQVRRLTASPQQRRLDMPAPPMRASAHVSKKLWTTPSSLGGQASAPLAARRVQARARRRARARNQHEVCVFC